MDHIDKQAKFRKIAIGDTVLACDHLSGQSGNLEP